MTNGVLTALNVFPLKSGGGTPLESAELTPEGLRHDREFMLVTPEGRFLSQREHPELALLRPSYDGRKLRIDVGGAAGGIGGPGGSTGAPGPGGTAGASGTAGGAGGSGGSTDAPRPGGAPAPLPFVHEVRDDGPVLEVSIRRSQCLGVDQGDEAAAWFSEWIQDDCRLVRFTGTRPTSRGGGTVAFADGYPVLVISAEALTDLNARLAASGSPESAPLPMNRFRPNLVIEGLGAYGEDSVRTLRIGSGVVLEMVKPCARCLITTTDQETAVRGREPLRTLASYRAAGGGVLFGQNAVPRATGTLRVGDPVEVLERMEPAVVAR